MADAYRFYKVCPTCNGTGFVVGGFEPRVCERCEDETEPMGTKIFDGLRHIYVGRFEELEAE